MNATELTRRIGQTATFQPSMSCRFQVTIKDARASFGRTDYLCVPVAGSGEAWISSDRLTFDSTSPREK